MVMVMIMVMCVRLSCRLVTAATGGGYRQSRRVQSGCGSGGVGGLSAGGLSIGGHGGPRGLGTIFGRAGRSRGTDPGFFVFCHQSRALTKTPPSRTWTSNVSIGWTAGMHIGAPVRRLNFAPWRGQMIEQSAPTGPFVSGCPSCEQTSSTAKNSSPTRISNEGMSSTKMEIRPPAGTSSTEATRSNSDMRCGLSRRCSY